MMVSLVIAVHWVLIATHTTINLCGRSERSHLVPSLVVDSTGRRKLDKLNSFIKSLQGFVENGAQGALRVAIHVIYAVAKRHLTQFEPGLAVCR